MSEFKVLDFNKKKADTIEQKRRAFNRIVFQNFLGAYSVIDDNGSIYPVTMVDIAGDGCSFQVPWNPTRDKKLASGFEVNMRMYFTDKSYIPVIMNVRHGKEVLGSDGITYMQYGCEFDKTVATFEAMQSFIDFIYRFAEHSAIDKGDTKVYFR
ncbi:PilZ domain-containing protein [Bacteriovorax sp. PP10]|uniref:PilZ domain-containing protein n=1 Tax=Bacteriovorax antarcticus TaxID=3088717 RepID=A0ABU5VVD0_9BACT|nr:PilZ domain-containing protein [Bacteriovorax sp. PP10]MEA9357013.1 PilZ domain-containing protein [Bacteriovorax sp. PP10]